MCVPQRCWTLRSMGMSLSYPDTPGRSTIVLPTLSLRQRLAVALLSHLQLAFLPFLLSPDSCLSVQRAVLAFAACLCPSAVVQSYSCPLAAGVCIRPCKYSPVLFAD